MRKSVSLIIVLLSSFIAGCAPIKPYVLSDYHRDPQFNRLEVLATGVVLGGITSSNVDLKDDERTALLAQLEDVLTKYSLYRINTPVKLTERIEPEQYKDLLEYFKQHSTLPESEFRKLEGLYAPARYLLFVTLDGDNVKQYTEDLPGEIAYVAARIMTARLYIFNMQTSAATLFTRIAIKDVNANKVQKLGGDNVGFLIGNIIAQATFGGFPEPPDRTHALYKLFYAVADQIPNS